ncbi:hypothetical protein [Plantactinospora sp. KLBMP9567]|uniref:hypothetical protein n=1 Tax=Plantactinospora sp. KLBMP9567 TaxID=3085900 RepID=UPI0029827830|nr:hypothetical protein [Plantactinospora sp. KLBMP9567]MDW5325618.1 hypothetical protein [Plantactinospora sp. KLBMP9567]
MRIQFSPGTNSPTTVSRNPGPNDAADVDESLGRLADWPSPGLTGWSIGLSELDCPLSASAEKREDGTIDHLLVSVAHPRFL